MYLNRDCVEWALRSTLLSSCVCISPFVFVYLTDLAHHFSPPSPLCELPSPRLFERDTFSSLCPDEIWNKMAENRERDASVERFLQSHSSCKVDQGALRCASIRGTVEIPPAYAKMKYLEDTLYNCGSCDEPHDLAWVDRVASRQKNVAEVFDHYVWCGGERSWPYYNLQRKYCSILMEKN